MLSPLPRSIAHTARFSRQKKHGLWNAARRGQYPICIVSIPIADRKVNVCMCKNDEFYESFIVVWKKLDAVQR